MHKRQISIIASTALLVVSQITLAADAAKTAKRLKIYILVGQSNMQGKAQVGTVPRMALSPESKALHDKILDEKGEPRVHKNVSAVYFTAGDTKKGEERPLIEKKGLLSTGLGDPIGPELGFGITLDEASEGPILIIKTAWGGKSLYTNFRPPSAGILPYTPPKSGGRRNAQPLSAEELAKKTEEYAKPQGVYYSLMMKLIKDVLADPGKYSDAYDPQAGYEIAGFGWFQGFNDMIAGNSPLYAATGDKPAFAEYTSLMAHFIRDVRKELNAPKMLFVIGVMGIGGPATGDGGNLALRQSQLATAQLPEFKGNVVAVETAGFWDKEVLAALEKVAQAQALWDGSEHWTVVGTPAPKDRIWEYTSFDLAKELHYRTLEKGEKGDIRTLTGQTPAELKDWLKADFDTSTWQKGPAPVGKGDATSKRTGKNMEKGQEIRSPWGEGNILLMKTTFTLDRPDLSNFRLCIQATGSYRVYLNGQFIEEYPWWKEDCIRRFEFDAKYVKQGSNELAFYGNLKDDKGPVYNAVDLYLEGLSKARAEEIRERQETVATPRDHVLAKGKSNQEYHYLGSAYTYSLIGEAMAKALIGLEKAAK